MICDPADLVRRDGALWRGRQAVDLVYNRLTDFSLQDQPRHHPRHFEKPDAIDLPREPPPRRFACLIKSGSSRMPPADGGALLTPPKASLIGSSRIASGQSIRTITGLQLALSLCSCVRQRLEPLLR